MQLVGVQFDIAWEQREENHGRVRELLRANPPKRGAMIVLPEMFSSGFSMNVRTIAEGSTRPTERFLIELAQELGIFIVAGVVRMAESGKGLNQSVTIDPSGSIIARYSKLHPFCLGGEKDCYDAGTEV